MDSKKTEYEPQEKQIIPFHCRISITFSSISTCMLAKLFTSYTASGVFLASNAPCEHHANRNVTPETKDSGHTGHNTLFLYVLSWPSARHNTTNRFVNWVRCEREMVVKQILEKKANTHKRFMPNCQHWLKATLSPDDNKVATLMVLIMPNVLESVKCSSGPDSFSRLFRMSRIASTKCRLLRRAARYACKAKDRLSYRIVRKNWAKIVTLVLVYQTTILMSTESTVVQE